MNRIICAVLAAALAAPALFAADAPKPAPPQQDAGWLSYFQTTLKGLKSTTARKLGSQNARVSAVAAVRGNKTGEEQPSDPYWKGSVSDKAVKQQESERKEFSAAVEMVLDGKPVDGASALMKFGQEHPKSVYLPDIKEALGKLPPDAVAEARKVQKAPAQTEALPKPASPEVSPAAGK